MLQNYEDPETPGYSSLRSTACNTLLLLTVTSSSESWFSCCSAARLDELTLAVTDPVNWREGGRVKGSSGVGGGGLAGSSGRGGLSGVWTACVD